MSPRHGSGSPWHVLGLPPQCLEETEGWECSLVKPSVLTGAQRFDQWAGPSSQCSRARDVFVPGAHRLGSLHEDPALCGVPQMEQPGPVDASCSQGRWPLPRTPEPGSPHASGCNFSSSNHRVTKFYNKQRRQQLRVTLSISFMAQFYTKAQVS